MKVAVSSPISVICPHNYRPTLHLLLNNLSEQIRPSLQSHRVEKLLSRIPQISGSPTSRLPDQPLSAALLIPQPFILAPQRDHRGALIITPRKRKRRRQCCREEIQRRLPNKHRQRDRRR